MGIKYSRFMVFSVAVALNLYAEESFSLKKQTLEESIKQIAQKSNMPYVADGKLLKGKSSKDINNVVGVQNALNKVLEGSGLKAVIKNQTILIVEKEKEISKLQKKNKSGNDLGEVNILANENDGSVETGYLVKELKQVGPWGAKSLQDTPYSMSVMSSDLIENILASEVDQLYRKNPIVDTAESMGYWGAPTASIRGFAARNQAIDGMSISADPAGNLEEVERVEIMNGLTGFMYGSGNVGGLVNYVLKRPTYKRLTNLTVGNYGGDSYFSHLDVGNKIDDEGKFAFRINASYQDGGTIYDHQNIEKSLISGVLDWNITDNLLLQFDASHREYTVEGLNLGIDIESSYYPSAKIFDIDSINAPSWGYSETDSDRYGVKLTYNINENFTLRSRYLHKIDDLKFTAPYTNFEDNGWDVWTYAMAPREIISDAGYLYLDSSFETGDIQHKLTMGASGDFNENKWNSVNANYDWGDSSGLTYDELLNYPKTDSPSTGFKYKKSESDNINIIIGDDITFNEHWSALIGFNYTKMKTKNYNTDGSISSEYDKSELTPTLSFVYKPFEDLTTYVSYMEGLEAGSVVASRYSNAGEVLEPLTSKQYEIGAKYSFNENLLLSSALFRIEKPNEFSDEAVPQPKYVQDGEEVHQGLELTLTGKVTDNLTLMLGGTIMDLSIEDASSKELEGKKPTNAASKMAKVYAEYTLPSFNALTFTAGAYYVGKKYANTDNSFYIPSSTTFDAGLRYKTKIDKYKTTFNLNVTNLTDKKYWSSVDYLGAPRAIMYSMKMEF